MIANSLDPQHPPFWPFSSAFHFQSRSPPDGLVRILGAPHPSAFNSLKNTRLALGALSSTPGISFCRSNSSGER